MNREQRRKLEKARLKEAKAMWPSGYVDIPEQLMNKFPDGTKFTMQGIRRLQDGTIQRNCKKGEETIFVSRVSS